MREKGESMGDIARKLGVAKSSVSNWVGDIELTRKQQKELSKKGHKKEVIEKRRKSRLANEHRKRRAAIDNAKKDIRNISKRDLWFIGIALYWGEGSKKKRGSLEFANSDPRLIKIMIRFFNEIYDVPKEKYRGHIHLHKHLDSKQAEEYWSEVSGIPIGQFFKTSQQHNIASKNKKDSLPYGTFSIYVCDVKLYLRMMGWMEGTYEKLIT